MVNQIKKIQIRVIPHNKQRYETIGDYFFDKKGGLQVRVSDLGDWRYNLAVIIHELIESGLCLVRGISFQDIDKFDMRFERERSAGLHSSDEEPGFSPNAPYLKEHRFATRIEKQLIKEFDINWDDYDKEV